MVQLITLLHVAWSTHVYFVVLFLLFFGYVSLAELFGYLAAFIVATVIMVWLLWTLRSGWNALELIIPTTLFAGVIYVIIDYFYLSGRTDWYILGVYASGVAVVETIRFLYLQPRMLETLHTFALLSHVYAGTLALGVWFFLYYFSNLTEDVRLFAILVLYASVGIIVEGLQALAKSGSLPWPTVNRALGLLYIVSAIFTVITLGVTYLVSNL